MPPFVRLGNYIIATSHISHIELGKTWIQIYFSSHEEPVELRHPSGESGDFLAWMQAVLGTRVLMPE